MKAFSIKEMLADFSRLLRRVTAGEEVIIKRAGTPVARLVDVQEVEATGRGEPVSEATKSLRDS